MIQEGNEACDGTLKINIVFPERIIGVDEQSLSAILPVIRLIIAPPGGVPGLVELNAFNEKSRVGGCCHSLMSTSSSAQHKKTRSMTGSAAKGPASAGLKVAPDLDKRLANSARTHALQSRRSHCARAAASQEAVEACGYLESIYWRQSDPDGLALHQSLESSTSPRDVKLRTYLKLNASRFDLIDENKPFVGSEPMPLGRDFIRKGSRASRSSSTSRIIPIRRPRFTTSSLSFVEDRKLEAVPYHIFLPLILEPAARALRDAAKLSDDPAFAKFLELRADALLSDDYFPSDLAWLDLKNPKVDIIFAPYETYMDSLLGVKGSYGRQ